MKIEERLKKVSYTEALTWWNRYMVNERIREYCQGICKGKCCSDIDTSKCRGHCQEKLLCVVFICEDKDKRDKGLMDIITAKNYENIYNVFKNVGKLYSCEWYPSYDKGTYLREKLEKLDFYIPKNTDVL